MDSFFTDIINIQDRDLREEFKKETGLRTIVEDGMGNSFYTEDYVEWLEDRVKKLHISDVMKRIEELKIEYINLPKDKFYSKDTMKRRKEEIEYIFDELNIELPWY